MSSADSASVEAGLDNSGAEILKAGKVDEDESTEDEIAQASDTVSERSTKEASEEEKLEDGEEEEEEEEKLPVESTVETNMVESKTEADIDWNEELISENVQPPSRSNHDVDVVEAEAFPQNSENTPVSPSAKHIMTQEFKKPLLQPSSDTVAVEDPMTTQSDGTAEVVEEVPLSVKEQVSIFANMKLQETHGKPKPMVAAAFSNSLRTEPPPSMDTGLPDQVQRSSPNRVEEFEKTLPPQSFDITETTSMERDEPQSRQPIASNFDRPQPHDRQAEIPPPPKKFVPKTFSSANPLTFGVPFGNNCHFTKPEPPAKVAAPSQYLGPDVVAHTTRPPVLIRLRRPGPEAPWGFTIFGGADYGCPPFISRVTLRSIAANAGLEVGDIVVSICESPVRDSEHSQVKAEILRAGNELDFMVVKQGIDKDILAQRAPHLLRPPASSVTDSSGSLHARKTSSGSVTYLPCRTPCQAGYADKATRTRSFRLLDEHLNAMSGESRRAESFQVQSDCKRAAGVRSWHCRNNPVQVGSQLGAAQTPTRPWSNIGVLMLVWMWPEVELECAKMTQQ
ncbi:unnamed protein product [Mesocestoides corti]|uniref:PDZ domain-containing protein n=1 Tax=Mesocestoides corti TaxID=53468 RepID=A0A0R3UKK0_MESCO|nr:unnamed protein product [Mesocestoides corti]